MFAARRASLPLLIPIDAWGLPATQRLHLAPGHVRSRFVIVVASAPAAGSPVSRELKFQIEARSTVAFGDADQAPLRGVWQGRVTAGSFLNDSPTTPDLISTRSPSGGSGKSTIQAPLMMFCVATALEPRAARHTSSRPAPWKARAVGAGSVGERPQRFATRVRKCPRAGSGQKAHSRKKPARRKFPRRRGPKPGIAALDQPAP